MNFKSMKYMAVGAVAAASVMAVSGQAHALDANGMQEITFAQFNATYSCAHAVYGQGGSYMGSSDSGRGIYAARSVYTPGCASGHTSNTAGSVVTATATLRAATVQTVGIITNRIAQVRTAQRGEDVSPVSMGLAEDGSQGTIGLAGGDAKRGIGVWVQGAYTWLDNDHASTKYDGNVLSFMGGVDYQVNQRILVGISGGYESTDLDTEFNRGTLEADGFLVAPYASFRINDIFSIDATGGYAWLDYEMDRLDAGNDSKFTGKTDATRAFGSAQVNADLARKAWRINLNAGGLYTKEERDAFTETNAAGDSVAVAKQSTKLGQAYFGGRVGYDLGKIMPFATLRGEYDLSKDKVQVAAGQTAAPDDDFGLKLGLGLNVYPGNIITGTIQGETTLLRDDWKEHKVLARIRADF